MSFVQDTLSIFKKRDLILLESKKLSEDVYTFHFEKDKDLTWKAGQHGLFTITHKKIKNATRPFSIASAPEEDHIKITTKIGDNPSDFKKAMLEIEKGMSFRMSGPVGTFYLKDNSPTLMVAGGMGITPFRSILKKIETEGNHQNQSINLLYIDNDNYHIFKDELDEISKNISLNIAYLNSKNDLNQEIDEYTSRNLNDCQYLIAGPKSMVDSISSNLINKGISKKNIKKDSFFGY